MPRAKITRRDEQGDVVKTFADSAPYEGLKPADIVEVEDGRGELRDYFVAEMKWDFSHFGDTLEILIQAVEMKPKQHVEMVHLDKQTYYVLSN